MKTKNQIKITQYFCLYNIICYAALKSIENSAVRNVIVLLNLIAVSSG